ncbi:glutamine amidotransferase class-I [Parafrankia sp. EAN1pec]|uniref:glutamine amidotransferase n=1 Tax=Parafrankia sp. (strain EAN1pec) TaxID=298653 RepID=UPI0000543061|nr:glutamine amidotransferase class-I [Frankia sp. EAN1pec]
MESHFDTFSVPPGARRLAWTADAEQAFQLGPHLGLDKRLPGLGVDLAALRAEIARRVDASGAASCALFDHFWSHARIRRRT